MDPSWDRSASASAFGTAIDYSFFLLIFFFFKLMKFLQFSLLLHWFLTPWTPTEPGIQNSSPLHPLNPPRSSLW